MTQARATTSAREVPLFSVTELKRSLKQREQYHYLAQSLRDLEEDLRWGVEESDRIPQAWHEIALRPPEPAKRKITLRIDADVEKFFRAMGRNHLTRMNAVLRTFMQARLAGVIKGAADMTYAPDKEELRRAGTRKFLSDRGVAAEREREKAGDFSNKERRRALLGE